MDGNYPDFFVGQKTAFALEFYASEPLTKMNSSQFVTPHYIYEGDTDYQIVGCCTYLDSDWFVLDVGLPIFTNCRAPKGTKIGDYFQGKICLGIDHYIYFEQKSQQPQSPSLIFDWQVNKIEVQTAPYIQDKNGHHIRDKSKWKWQEIARTECGRDQPGPAEYRLHCALLSRDPRREL